MKPLPHCANDNNPVQPPSLVLCKTCLEALDRKMQAILDNWPAPAEGTGGKA